jgi:hypothetical protein
MRFNDLIGNRTRDFSVSLLLRAEVRSQWRKLRMRGVTSLHCGGMCPQALGAAVRIRTSHVANTSQKPYT